MQDQRGDDERDQEPDTAVKRQAGAVHPDPAGQHRAEAQQGRQIEEVGAQHDAEADGVVPTPQRDDGRRDFGRVGAQGRQQPQESFREADAGAELVDPADKQLCGAQHEGQARHEEDQTRPVDSAPSTSTRHSARSPAPPSQANGSAGCRPDFPALRVSR